MFTATISYPPINSVFGDDTPRVRLTDPVTSHEAADSNNVVRPRVWVLETLTRMPLADHELVEQAHDECVRFTPQRLRTARAELVRAGIVEASGIYRLTENSRRAVVWQRVSANSLSLKGTKS